MEEKAAQAQTQDLTIIWVRAGFFPFKRTVSAIQVLDGTYHTLITYNAPNHYYL